MTQHKGDCACPGGSATSEEPALLSLSVSFRNKASSSSGCHGVRSCEAEAWPSGKCGQPPNKQLCAWGDSTSLRSAPLNLVVSTAATRSARPAAAQNACFLVTERAPMILSDAKLLCFPGRRQQQHSRRGGREGCSFHRDLDGQSPRQTRVADCGESGLLRGAESRKHRSRAFPPRAKHFRTFMFQEARGRGAGCILTDAPAWESE